MSTSSEEILHHAVHGHEPLHVSGRLEAPHLLLALPNRLVGDRDSPLSEQIFRVAEAETEPVIQPHSVTDDFGRGIDIRGSWETHSSSTHSATSDLKLTVPSGTIDRQSVARLRLRLTWRATS